ncbi:MAG: hypothetical protein AAFR61_00110 [Bacteroidota bacterium]
MEGSGYISLYAAPVLIWALGYLHTGKFVRPRWKIPGKFLFYVGVSAALTYFLGYWSLLFIIGHQALGLIFHIRVCKKHQINWLNCEPRERYLALQEQWARGEFGDKPKPGG